MLLFTAAIALCAPLAAEPGNSLKTPPFKLSGLAGGYYRYNLNNPEVALYNNLTSFTNSHKSFELSMISVKAEYTIGRVGLVAGLGFGRRAEQFSYTDANTRFVIKQLYGTYALTEKLKLTGGSWATHIGYESVDSYVNRSYSTSYVFLYGPFFHTGFKADFALNEKTTLMAGLANPTDLKGASGTPKTFIAQPATSAGDGKLKSLPQLPGRQADRLAAGAARRRGADLRGLQPAKLPLQRHGAVPAVLPDQRLWLDRLQALVGQCAARQSCPGPLIRADAARGVFRGQKCAAGLWQESFRSHALRKFQNRQPHHHPQNAPG
ncbi:MAG: outer membrane beta-barrel protein [Hymenobacter sp.]|nr:outer membrane beta-barrel protein [Hymenobacter sp.]